MLIKNRHDWIRVISSGKGYIYNDFGTQFPGDSPTWNTTDFNKLHMTSCSHVKRMKLITEGKFTKHRARADRNRKKDGYTLCKNCNP